MTSSSSSSSSTSPPLSTRFPSDKELEALAEKQKIAEDLTDQVGKLYPNDLVNMAIHYRHLDQLQGKVDRIAYELFGKLIPTHPNYILHAALKYVTQKTDQDLLSFQRIIQSMHTTVIRLTRTDHPTFTHFLFPSLSQNDAIPPLLESEVDRDSYIQIALNYRQLPALKRPAGTTANWEVFKCRATYYLHPFQHQALIFAINKLREQHLDYSVRIQSLETSINLISSINEPKREEGPSDKKIKIDLPQAEKKQ